MTQTRPNVPGAPLAREAPSQRRRLTLLERIRGDVAQLTAPSTQWLRQPSNLATRTGRWVHPGRFPPTVADRLLAAGLLVRTPRLHHRALRAVWPSLLDQLDAGASAGESNPGGVGGGFGSHPPERLDAVEAWVTIGREARAELAYLAPGRRPRRYTDMVRGLGALAEDLDPDSLERLAHLVGRWRIMARCATGWETPAWRPAAPCLRCDQVGSLRIRLDPIAAWCTACHETWDAATIGLLGSHVQAYTERHRHARQASGAAPPARTEWLGCGARLNEPVYPGVPGLGSESLRLSAVHDTIGPVELLGARTQSDVRPD